MQACYRARVTVNSFSIYLSRMRALPVFLLSTYECSCKSKPRVSAKSRFLCFDFLRQRKEKTASASIGMARASVTTSHVWQRSRNPSPTMHSSTQYADKTVPTPLVVVPGRKVTQKGAQDRESKRTRKQESERKRACERPTENTHKKPSRCTISISW